MTTHPGRPRGKAPSLSVGSVPRRFSWLKSSDFDRQFDDGESVVAELQLEAAKRPRLQQKRVNVDFPLWMVEQLGRDADRQG